MSAERGNQYSRRSASRSPATPCRRCRTASVGDVADVVGPGAMDVCHAEVVGDPAELVLVDARDGVLAGGRVLDVLLRLLSRPSRPASARPQRAVAEHRPAVDDVSRRSNDCGGGCSVCSPSQRKNTMS